MNQGTSEVKSGGVVVGSCNYNIYESVDEITANISEEDHLEIFNAMVKTRSMNTLRSEVAGGGKVTQKAITGAVQIASVDQLVALQTAIVARNDADASGDTSAYQEAEDSLRTIISEINNG